MVSSEGTTGLMPSRLIDAARLQLIVIGALMMRELHTRYGRENLGFLWLVVEPMMLCGGVMIIWYAIHGRTTHGGIDVLGFVMTGYLPLTLWRHITNRAVHCFRANASLLYHRQVRMLDLMAARILLEIGGTAVTFLLMSFAFWAVGLYDWPKDWGLYYLGWFYFAVFAAALGLILSALTEMYEWTEKLVGPFMYLMLPACGCFFMVDWLPSAAQQYVLYIPSVGAYELIRGGQFGPDVRVHYWLAYETFICAALLALGLVMISRVHKHLVIE